MVATNNQDGPEITMYAAGDLNTTGGPFHIITIDASGYAKLADDADAPTEPLIGVLQNDPDAAGESAVIRIAGIAKVMSEASIDEGVPVTTNSSSHAIAAITSDWVLGVAMTAGVSGSLMEVLLHVGQGGAYTAPS